MTIFEFIRAQLVGRQQGFVFPGNQHVADTALNEGVRCATGAGVQHLYVFEQGFNELLSFSLVTVVLVQA